MYLLHEFKSTTSAKQCIWHGPTRWHTSFPLRKTCRRRAKPESRSMSPTVSSFWHSAQHQRWRLCRLDKRPATETPMQSANCKCHASCVFAKWARPNPDWAGCWRGQSVCGCQSQPPAAGQSQRCANFGRTENRRKMVLNCFAVYGRECSTAGKSASRNILDVHFHHI